MKLNDKHLSYIGSSPDIAIDKQGWLSKKGELNTSYQRRYCILKGNLLFYYEKSGSENPIGVIVLEGCCVQLAEGGDSPYTFSILFPGEGTRVYKLTADDDATCNAWIKALTNSSYQYLEILVEGLEKEVKALKNRTETVTINLPSEDSTPTASTSSLSSNEHLRSSLTLGNNTASNPEITFLKDHFLSSSLSVKSNSVDTLTDTSDYDEPENNLLDFNIYTNKKTKSKSENLRRSKSTDALSSNNVSIASTTRTTLKGKNSPRLSKFMKPSPKSRRKKEHNTMRVKVSEQDWSMKTTAVCRYNNFLELHKRYTEELKEIMQQN